ncbi:hypothetical protein CEG14_10135 [Bordetella genomosp. 1]|uniref:ABC transporter substrate-binding protein n=1 Tax=Bordetella genomosp. 1 TaxID=1395607 RepID=A0A261SF48_9BORD|nr:tripartite tricarboxylate transporter substrate-binding protein [Bordetella genomosp. 1]OZI35440.1 hypothetical protein CEG14_10135 [Bordetella genomosp. 1]
MQRIFQACAAGVLALACGAAQAWPDRAITVVVPYAPGGSTDVLARVLADGLGRQLGQPVVVENAGGAGGTIGTTRVVRAQPDGYTVLLHNMAVASAPALYARLPYDVTRDLQAVAPAGEVPMILVRNKNFAPDSVQALIQAMRAEPNAVNFSHAGVGATSHLCALLFTHTARAQATLVPYRGTGPALQDLVAGNVDLICDQPVATLPHIQSGALKPYAVATRERLPALPEVPTFAQAGLPDFELSVWHGFYVPKGTPAAAVERLNQAVRAVLADPATAKRLTDMAVLIPPAASQTPQALQTYTAAETRRWAEVVKATGVKPQ